MSCPCCSGQDYEMCCAPFHQGELPKTALELMRSRYSAYKLNLPDYIMATTHPLSPHYRADKEAWRREISAFSTSCSFDKLEVIDTQEREVTFIAHLREGSRDVSFKERSLFEKVKGRWLYLNGQHFL